MLKTIIGHGHWQYNGKGLGLVKWTLWRGPREKTGDWTDQTPNLILHSAVIQDSYADLQKNCLSQLTTKQSSKLSACQTICECLWNVQKILKWLYTFVHNYSDFGFFVCNTFTVKPLRWAETTVRNTITITHIYIPHLVVIHTLDYQLPFRYLHMYCMWCNVCSSVVWPYYTCISVCNINFKWMVISPQISDPTDGYSQCLHGVPRLDSNPTPSTHFCTILFYEIQNNKRTNLNYCSHWMSPWIDYCNSVLKCW